MLFYISAPAVDVAQHVHVYCICNIPTKIFVETITVSLASAMLFLQFPALINSVYAANIDAMSDPHQYI